MTATISEYLDTNRAEILEFFSQLHNIAEPAFREVKTSAFLKLHLLDAGFEVTSDFAGPALLGRYDSGNAGPTVCLRADMDALTYERDGQLTYIHSCGHDANCTAAFWAAKALLEAKRIRRGTMLVLFQPAEENLQGAEAVIQSGILRGTDYMIATHLRPRDELPMGLVSPAVLHGASGHMQLVVYGSDAHGARPHQGVNAIQAAAVILGAVNALPFDPSVPHSIKPTKMSSGGSANNVIPDRAELVFDLRAQTNELMEQQKQAIEKAAQKTAEAMGASVKTEWLGGVPAASRCEDLIRIATKAIQSNLGEAALGREVITPGGEDFHRYPLAIQGLKSTVLGIGADLIPGLHKADMSFDHLAMLNAITALYGIVESICRE